VVGLVAHSTLDFSARMPAVGLLAATLLGLATVALHNRLVPGREQLLSGTRTLALGRPGCAAVGVLAALAMVAWTWTWIDTARAGTAEEALAGVPPAELSARAEAVLALDARSPQGLLIRARERQRAALAAWQSPPAAGVERDRRPRELLAQARADLRAALTVTPTNPWLHLDLAWVEASDAVVQGRGGPEGLAPALTHGARAVALGATSPLFYAGMARLAYSMPELGLRAAHEAVRRRPTLLPEMIELYRPLGLTEPEWLALVPATAVDRLDLAVQLQAHGSGAGSLAAFRAAVVAAPREHSVYAWALAEALGRARQEAEAVQVLRAAAAADAGNPELERALGAALARRNDPEALAHLRAAVGLMDRGASTVGWQPFALGGDARLGRIVSALAGDLDRPVRYRRALAGYLTDRRLWDHALLEWRSLVATEPRDAEARFGLGLAREGAGAADEALEAFRAAVELDPRSARYRGRLAERLWQSEQYFQAINEWRALKEQQPRDVEVRLALGRAYEKVGQPTDAYREYREVLVLQPEQADAARAVARMQGRRR
jgi:Flp pilus assembly protein TadD